MVVVVSKHAIADDHQVYLFHRLITHFTDFKGREQLREGGGASVGFYPLEPIGFGVKELTCKSQVLKDDAVVPALQIFCVA